MKIDLNARVCTEYILIELCCASLYLHSIRIYQILSFGFGVFNKIVREVCDSNER